MLVQRSVTHLIMVIVTVVMPSAVALVWYYFSQDPTVRPLGITQESLRAFNGEMRIYEIVAEVAGAGRGGTPTAQQIERELTGVFHSKGVAVRVNFLDSNIAGTRITYRIGPSTIGPYPYARAVEGINAAIEAYRMSAPVDP